MDRIDIRKARNSDFSLIENYTNNNGDSPWDPFCSAKKMKTIPRNGFLVAFSGTEFAGFLYWFKGSKPWFDKNVDTYAHILEVQVAETFRGKGVGTELLKA